MILSTWILPVEFLFAKYPIGKIKRLCFCVQYQFESAERTQYNQLVEAEVYAAQASFQYPQSRIDLRIFPMQFSALYANDSSIVIPWEPTLPQSVCKQTVHTS